MATTTLGTRYDRAPAVLDSASLARQAEYLRREAEEDRFRAWVNLETINSMYLADERYDPTNAPARLGRPMSSSDLESVLSRLNPSLRFIWGGLNTSKKWLARALPDGSLERLFPYEAGIMPERSIMSRKRLEVPDPSVLRPGPTGFMGHIERSDVPDGTGAPDGPAPGFRYVDVPWREEVRGWRTVVLRLIVLGLISPADAERAFGHDQTPEWSSRVLGHDARRPW